MYTKTKLKIGFLFFFMAVLCFSPITFAEKMDKIAAIVNGDIITEEELNLFIRMADSDQKTSADVKELRKDLLERMIEDRLILQEAKREQIKIDEKVLEDRVRDIKQRAGSEDAFEMALKSQGINLNELREKISNQMMIFNLVQKEIKTKVNISPKDVTDYFQENQDQFVTPETVVVDSIFVKDKDALKEAQVQLGEGKDFNEVAKTYSQKTNLGAVPRGQLKKDLEDFVFSLEPGKPSKPFQVEDGYYVFLAKEKLAASKKSIDEVKDKITLYLENEKMEKMLKEWIEDLKDKAYISVREP